MSAPATEPAPPEALCALELTTIHEGIGILDVMAKAARTEILAATPIPPGRFLIVLGGPVAEVEVAFQRGLEIAYNLHDRIYLPEVHPGVLLAARALDAGVVAARGSQRPTGPGESGAIDSIGLFETRSISAALAAADRGLKGTSARLLHLHLARGVAGKGIGLFEGRQDAVEAALELARERAEQHGGWIGATLLARPDPDVAARLLRAPWGFFQGQELL
ncbi:MAG: BMC domain-containing protein [Candidatus Eisenbacteria bacterium]|nr:BMC domain-containing protein [Candidatus Eisenbacteria bacterium]MCC7141838.1 BMC domain-containing protein [Candidatus Eisenbacteria bacterium]